MNRPLSSSVLTPPAGAPIGLRRRGAGRRPAPSRPGREAGGPTVWLLAALWILLLTDIQYWLAIRGVPLVTSSIALMLPALAITMPLSVLSRPERRDQWTWFPPFLAFLAIVAIMVPFTVDRQRSFAALQILALFWLLIVGTVSHTTSARRAELLLLAFGLQFAWWGAWGFRSGLVLWSPVLANFDGYGAYMVIGGGYCAFLVVAIGKNHLKWVRRILMAAVGLCAVGMVASMARGAFLAGLTVAGMVWLRSEKKIRALGIALACGILVIAAEVALFGGEYWAEMSTILQGTGEATGEDRWEMWKAAFGVFLQSPVFGVGSANWSVYAADFYQPGELGGQYGINPRMLWGVSAHNSFVSTLAENGLVGLIAFMWLFWDFWKRNRELRTQRSGQRWIALGGKLQLHALARATEAAMVGWIVAASLYSMTGTHWLYSILAINMMMHALVTSRQAALTESRRAPAIAHQRSGSTVRAGQVRGSPPLGRRGPLRRPTSS